MKYLFLLFVLIGCADDSHPCEKLLNKGNAVQFNIESSFQGEHKSETFIVPPSNAELNVLDTGTISKYYESVTIRYVIENSNSVESVGKNFHTVKVLNCQVVK